MVFAPEPFDSTFTIKMCGSPPPWTVWAFDDAVPVFDFQLHMLGVNVSLAIAAGEKPGLRHTLFSLLRSRWTSWSLLLPSAGTVVVYMCYVGFDRFERVVVAVLLFQLIVSGIELQHTFELLLRSGFPLSE